ncbi:unnamed protein product, partial [Didymodactylos carnosus]
PYNSGSDTRTSSAVTRIPITLRQEYYKIYLEPDLINNTYKGVLDYQFRCLKSTNLIHLHMIDLIIDNSSILILSGTLRSPKYQTWKYDKYNEFMIITFDSSFVQDTVYHLNINYTGNFSDSLSGFYISKYNDTKSQPRTLMTSQMEPTHARTAFPCIDEPARKAIFQISVRFNSSYRIWSNTELENETYFNDGTKLTVFKPTLKMSTFILALIVALEQDFGCRPAQQIRGRHNISHIIRSSICGRKDILEQLSYAEEVATKSLHFFNEYYDMDYPLEKIDHFAVPDFGAGAMENYGLLIYREVGLFFDEKTVSASRKQYITTVVAHEIAHQWFGNLVSPEWWGELWLKEGFASYMETLASDQVEPDWKQDERFVVEKIFSFMEADSLPTSRPISINSTNPADIFQLFDAITYDKGATLIRMMSMFLGNLTFQQGIQNYLKNLSYESATQDDLWSYLSKAANNTISVSKIMNGWTTQAGYPILDIQRSYGNIKQLHIKQTPFSLLSSTDKHEKWWIPFKYFDMQTVNRVDSQPLIWVNETTKTINITTANDKWILANPGYLGIYRTKYDQENFRLIVQQLNTDHSRIPIITRGALIDDTFALTRTGTISTTDAYDLMRYLKYEKEFVPWTAAFSAMRYQEDLLSSTEILMNVQQYFLELVLPLYNRIGWDAVDQSKDWLTALLQPSVLSAACRYEHKNCIDIARSKFLRWKTNPSLNQIPATLRSTVYCIAIRDGTMDDFYFLWDRLQRETVASEVLNLLTGMACTKDNNLITFFLNQHLKDKSAIREQDIAASLQRVARSPQANQLTWNYIRENWSKLFAKFGKSLSLSGIIDSVTSRFVTHVQRDEFEAFSDSIPDKGTASRQFILSMDKINAALYWKKKNIDAITEYLSASSHKTNASQRLPSDVVPIHYFLWVKPYLNITNDNLRFSIFDGTVHILLNITRPTNRIVLHKKYIDILSVSLMSRDNVQVISHSSDVERDFFIIMLNKNLTVGSLPTLNIQYVGELRNDTYGFYLSSYIRSDKTRGYLVSSQMEPIAARRALPCFDEPASKARFTITVEHDKRYSARSNMEVIGTPTPVPNDSDWVTTRFAESLPMSTYLLALVVSDFKCVTNATTGRRRNIITNVCAQPEKVQELYYALQVASQNIEDFENQYDLDYPLKKIDHIAVPDFDAGAMENWGIIIYRETRLYYNNKTSTPANKQDVAFVIVHELAHQWFGDLVSPAWWDDLWLNEGFAKWMEFIGTDRIHPDWHSYEQFISQRWLAVMQNDAVSFSHPINMQITHNDQLTSIFDSITYSKGSSILRMMRNFMGSTTFDKGVTQYLTKHQYQTAKQTDLWTAMGQAMIDDHIPLPTNTTLEEIMSTWTDQMGYPYIQIDRDYVSNTINVTQKQFLFDVDAQPPKSQHNYLWWIPLKIRSRLINQSDITWLNKNKRTVYNIPSISTSPDQWLLANPDLLGFFRTNYDERNWNLIIKQLINGHENFTVTERAGLVDDVFNLARAGIVPASLVFDMLKYATKEEKYIVWERILSGVSYIEQMLSHTPTFSLFKAYMTDLIMPIYNSLTWTEKPTEDWLSSLHRDLIISAACRYDISDCITIAKTKFDEWQNQPLVNNIDANQRRVVYCTAIRLGSRNEFQFLLNQFQLSNDPLEKARIQLALTCTRDIELLRHLLNIHLNENVVRRQDALSGIRSICRNYVAETECWSFIQKRWHFLFKELGGSLSFADLIKDITARFNTESHLTDFEQFSEGIQDKGAAAAEFKATIERIRANMEWTNKAEIDIFAWFINRTLDVRLPTDWIPNLYVLEIDIQLKSTLPNNIEPDTRFNGHITITVNCSRPTSELKIHAKNLRIQSATLKRIDSRKNILVDWSFINLTEVMVCRLSEQCQLNHLYTFDTYYITELDREMAGFYLSRYNVTINNVTVTHNIAATHMQPTVARKVFPCFDEPAMKAQFSISIIHDSSFSTVRSNGELIKIIPLPDGRIHSYFNITPPMSTYLVAFVVTDFSCIKNVTNRDITVSVCGRPEAIQNFEGHYALDVASDVISYFEDSYNVSYPLRKCDHFAIPDFSAGAMENWGLITYRETALLYNNVTGNLANKLRVGEVVSHEVAHQWFGNIVTPQWWNDIWLNEGFASWVEVLGLNHANPDFHPLDVFVTATLQRALVMDSLFSSHPISVDVEHPDDINSIFDAISYDKGSSILRMIYTVVTEPTFYRGVSNYLNAFAYKNAVQDQLWQFMTDATSSSILGGEVIKTIMDTWTLQEGYPLLTVTRNYTNNQATIRQNRFTLDSNATNQTSRYINPFKPPFRWYIPYNYQSTNRNVSMFEWLKPNENKTIRVRAGFTDWLLFNINQFGFYRVNYDSDNWNRIITALKSPNYNTSFSSVTRSQLIDDAFNLARSRDLNAIVPLQLSTYLCNETEYIPFSAFSTNIQYPLIMFSQNESSTIYKQLQKYVQNLEKPIYTQLGWFSAGNDNYLKRQLGSLVIGDLCANGLTECINRAVQEYSSWKQNPTKYSINPDYRSAVYCQGVKSGTDADFEFLLDKYKSTNDQVEKNRFGYALTCTKSERLLSELLNDTLKGQYIRLQDSSTFIGRISVQPGGQKLAWKYISTHWTELVQKLGGLSFTLSNIVESVLQYVNTEEELRTVEAFISDTQDLSIAERAFLSSIEKMHANIRWMNVIGNQFREWLNLNVNRTVCS